MPDVIIVPRETYATVSDDDLPRFLYYYARRVDFGDSQMTPIVSSLPHEQGQPDVREMLARDRIYRQRTMASYVGKPSPVTADAVLQQTYEAFERAVGWAGSGGRLAVGLGHGTRGAGQLYVAMAPLRFFPAHRVHFQRATEALAGRRATTDLDRQTVFLLRVARLVRDSLIAGIDFLSCDIGVGSAGRRLLQAAANAFACEVRGLRGSLEVSMTAAGFTSGLAQVVPRGSSCTAPRGRRPSFPYCTELPTLPRDPRLWLAARPEERQRGGSGR